MKKIDKLNEIQTGNENSGKTGDKIPQKSRKSKKTPKEVMDRHIKDENDVITDEEFKNLDTGTDMAVEKDTAHEPLDIDNNPNRPKDEDKDGKVVTPWDVIS